MLDDLDLSGVTDPEARRILGVLLNVIETQAAEIATLRAENQRLRDEHNRLKGEQGTPTILPSKRAAKDHASERERRAERPARPRVDKRSLLRLDRIDTREVDPTLLPSDAERKGYAEFVVQDVALHTDTVLFRCARWYAASTGRSYQAPLPEGYHDQGHYGPGLKALALQLGSDHITGSACGKPTLGITCEQIHRGISGSLETCAHILHIGALNGRIVKGRDPL